MGRAYSVCCAALRVPTAQKLANTHLLGGLHVSLHEFPQFDAAYPHLGAAFIYAETLLLGRQHDHLWTKSIGSRHLLSDRTTSHHPN